MTVKTLFDFITDPTIEESKVDEYLDEISEKAAKNQNLTNEEIVTEEVFKNAYIPQNLNQVIDFERDMKLVAEGRVTEDDLNYKTLLGFTEELKPKGKPDKAVIKVDLKSAEQTSSQKSEQNESGIGTTSHNSGSGTESESDSDDSNDDEPKSKFINSARPKDESPESKKARKKAVKDQQAEKRKSKVKKHVKKKKEKSKKIK